MMLAAVERRFGTKRAPHPVEHLSDNGSCYTAKDTRNFALALGLVPCFTPVRSPESNGMSREIHLSMADLLDPVVAARTSWPVGSGSAGAQLQLAHLRRQRPDGPTGKVRPSSATARSGLRSCALWQPPRH